MNLNLGQIRVIQRWLCTYLMLRQVESESQSNQCHPAWWSALNRVCARGSHFENECKGFRERLKGDTSFFEGQVKLLRHQGEGLCADPCRETIICPYKEVHNLWENSSIWWWNVAVLSHTDLSWPSQLEETKNMEQEWEYKMPTKVAIIMALITTLSIVGAGRRCAQEVLLYFSHHLPSWEAVRGERLSFFRVLLLSFSSVQYSQRCHLRTSLSPAPEVVKEVRGAQGVWFLLVRLTVNAAGLVELDHKWLWK